jgi:hypothetical protein
MNKRKDNNLELEELVLKVFLKHIKANNLYVAFRLSVNHDDGRIKDIFHNFCSKAAFDFYHVSVDKVRRNGSPFMHVRSFDDMTAMMRECNGGKKLTVTNDGKFQIAIMQMVNNLLHSCVEYAVTKDIRLLEKIGSAIFEEVCKKLFGDAFVDKTEEAFDANQRDFLKKIQEMGIPNPEHLDRDFFELMRRSMSRRRALGEMPPPPQEGDRLWGFTEPTRVVERYPWVNDDDLEIDWDDSF